MILRATILFPLLLGACASRRDAASGISPSEVVALEKTYHWSARLIPPTFANGELERLMDRSTDPTLDGETAEFQTSAVAVALATVGDERFAQALVTRSKPVQVTVIQNVHFFWSHHKLSYPKTQAIAATLPI